MGTFKAGFARVEITPKVPAYLAGYAMRNKPSEAVHDPLFLRTVVIDDGDTRIAIASNDLCLIDSDPISDLQKMIADVGFSPEHLFIAATHTHSGPVAYGEHVDAEWLEGWKHKVVESVLVAEKRLQAIRIGVNKGTCNVGLNRRERQPDGTIRLGKNPDGPVDRELGVIRLDDMEDNPLALILNYGCHGTTLGGRNYQISGDYMGKGVRLIENQASGHPFCMFLTGAAGNVDPRHRVGESFEQVRELGEELSTDALLCINSQLTTKDSHSHGNIRILSKKVEVPRKAEEVGKGAAKEVSIPLSLILLNNLLLITFPGEPFAETGMELKKRSSYENTFVVGYCNGSVGYLPTPQAYAEGGYEVNVTHCAPEAERIFVAEVIEMMRQISNV